MSYEPDNLRDWVNAQWEYEQSKLTQAFGSSVDARPVPPVGRVVPEHTTELGVRPVPFMGRMEPVYTTGRGSRRLDSEVSAESSRTRLAEAMWNAGKSIVRAVLNVNQPRRARHPTKKRSSRSSKKRSVK